MDSQTKNESHLSGAGLATVWGLVLLLAGCNPEKGANRDSETPSDPAHGRSSQVAGQKRYPGNYTVEKGFTNLFDPKIETTAWWSEAPGELRKDAVDTGTNSNILQADYTGPQACAECHQDKYDAWSLHAHRWMNATAIPAHVKGDFSGKAAIEYQGGVGTFYQEDGQYRMKLARGPVMRVYSVARTIGSRFFQYYTGRLIDCSGNEPSSLRETEHVLPFGYWIDSKEWVPTVHVYRDTDYYDDARDVYTDHEIAPYDTGCSACHTTRAFGDWLAHHGGGKRMSAYGSRSTAFDIGAYLTKEHPNLIPSRDAAAGLDKDGKYDARAGVFYQDFKEHGVAHGITCESCHNGGRAHVAHSTKTESKQLPYFFPVGDYIHSKAEDFDQLVRRSDANVNLICARCHSGGRKSFANGAHTWNSTEFADGVRGFCYTRKTGSHPDARTLTCVTCHDPHEGIGRKWKLSEKQNSAKCIACHQQFKTSEALTAHTHHGADSAGSQCMNCHNPKINEGLQDMVHTHRTFNPTDKAMIEANHPNACNMCHVDQPIDWTIDHLREWYGDEHRYSSKALLKNYPNRKEPVALGWLKSTHHPTRLVAADSLAKQRVDWAMPHLLDLLANDSNIINRQFTQRGIDQALGVKLKDMGYQFYHPEKQRRSVIAKLKDELVERAKKAAAE